MTAIRMLGEPIRLPARRDRRRVPLAVGAAPRVELLPPSVLAERRLRRSVHGVGLGLIATVLLTLTGVGVAFGHSSVIGAELARERDRTTELLASQGAFAEVSQVLSGIAEIETAQVVAGAGDVLWADVLDSVESGLPAGATVSGLSMTAEAVPASGTSPAATLALTVTSADIGAVRVWLESLTGVTGYVSADLTSVTQSDAVYTAQIQLVLDSEIYSNRFAAEATDVLEETS